MLNEQDVRTAIAETILDLDVDSLDSEAPFEDANIDSLDHANILLLLQERFGLQVPDEDLDQCSSINGILEYAKRAKS